MQARGESAQRDHRLLTSTLMLLASPDVPDARPHDSSICDEAADIARARQDPAAFAPLYERYVDAIYGYCLRRISDREQRPT